MGTLAQESQTAEEHAKQVKRERTTEEEGDPQNGNIQVNR